MACKITKNSLTASIKDQIINNATSYNEGLDWVFIPVGPNITSLAATRKVAEDKVQKLNLKYNSKAYGKVASIALAAEGTMINIHPNQILVDDLNFKAEYKTDKALQEQLDREERLDEQTSSNILNNIKEKTFKNKNSLIQYLRESTNPYFYKIKKTSEGWKAEIRDDYKWMENKIHKLEDCR